MSCEELKIIDAKNLPVGKLITMISRGHTIYINHKIEEYGINASQLHLLFEIDHENEINQEKIASRCNINKGSVARSIKKLEDKGLVMRKVDDENRRQNKITITEKGEEVLNESINQLSKWEDEVINNSILEKEELQIVLKEILINTIELNQMESKNE